VDWKKNVKSKPAFSTQHLQFDHIVKRLWKTNKAIKLCKENKKGSQLGDKAYACKE